jgi:hypothetical protein
MRHWRKFFFVLLVVVCFFVIPSAIEHWILKGINDPDVRWRIVSSAACIIAMFFVSVCIFLFVSKRSGE